MNILLVILHADPARGGAERYTRDLAAALAARGHPVDLAARTFADPPPGVGRIDLNGGGRSRLEQYHRFMDRLESHLASRRYDIVHAMLPVRSCDIYHPHAGIAAETMTHGGGFTRFRNRFNRRRAAFARIEGELLRGQQPPVTLCLSNVIRRTLLRHYSLPDDRMAMLFNAVDLERFDPGKTADAWRSVRRQYGIPDAAPLAAMIAQDFERKGLKQTLHAMRQWRPDGYLIVTGKPNPSPWRRLARSLGVDQRVIFTGPLGDPRPIYAAADFLVLPTRHDPCSLVVLEALAMGLPVITTTCNGASEIMTDGVHGFVLDDPGDESALTKAMTRLSDGGTRARMHQACLALRPQLAYEAHLNRLLEIYQMQSHRGHCPESSTPPTS